MIRAAGQLTFRTRIRSHLHELIYENRNFRKLRVGRKIFRFLEFFHLESNIEKSIFDRTSNRSSLLSNSNVVKNVGIEIRGTIYSMVIEEVTNQGLFACFK